MCRPVLIAALACLLAPALALGTDAAEGPQQRRIGSDTFVFGGHVRIDQPVPGDLIAAGGRLDVDAPVADDAMLASGRIRITAAVAQGVYAAGGEVTLDAPIGRHLRVAGGQVELGPQATVGGNVSAAGGQLTLRGTVQGAVTVAGGRVLIDGPVAGDVVSHAGRLTLGPNARLAGKLSHRSGGDLERDPAAQVAGAVERLALPIFGDGAASSTQPRGGTADRDWGSGPGGAMHERGLRWPMHGGAWPGLGTLGLMAFAALLVWALPVSSHRVADAVRQRPGWSLLWGFVALVCIPAAAIVLLLTIVGIPLALIALLAYPALLLLGYVGGALALGQWSLSLARPAAVQQRGWRIAAAMAAVLVLAGLASLPFVGGFVVLLAMLAGLGAMLLLAVPGAAPAAPAQRAGS